MKFIYQARNREGQVKNGVVVALDRIKAEQLLAENGLIITSLEVQEDSLIDRFNPFGKRVSNKDLVLFSRQLSTLIAARVPILQALRILETQTTNKRLGIVVRDLIASIENGESFSLALSKHPDIFGNIYVSLVKSGEVSGSLNKSLVYLADQLEKDYELRAKVKSSLTYPTFVIGTLVVVGILMFKFVLPKLTVVLKEQGGDLPTVSKVLIMITDFFDSYWYIVIILLGMLVVGGRAYITTVAGRYQWDKLKLEIPVFKVIFTEIYLSRFSRNLSTLVAGGIPIIQALKIMSELIGNVIYRDILMDGANKLAEGKSVSEALSGHKEFPVLVTQMIKVGEQTAKLDEILAKLADFYEKEVDAKVSTLTTLMEPIIMIILGLGVGALVAGILLPIYNLASTVS
jgi:type II secretory pathway component PulF